jgi:hypothetical protein
VKPPSSAGSKKTVNLRETMKSPTTYRTSDLHMNLSLGYSSSDLILKMI